MDFRIVADNMAGAARRTDDRQVPYVMFTDPPLARVGLCETEAQRQGVPVRIGRLAMSQVLRTEATVRPKFPRSSPGFAGVAVAV